MPALPGMARGLVATRRRCRSTGVVAAGLSVALLFPTATLAATTVDFENQEAGTTLTDQDANVGGTGQGVVFGPLPGSGAPGLHPVVRVPPAGQAQSGTHVADIATCPGCEFYTPNTTGTFSVPRSTVSVDVGLLGPTAFCSPLNPTATSCAFVTLHAYDAVGNDVGSQATLVKQGLGVHAPLSVSTPSATIVGFQITARSGTDAGKQIAIDDLSFDVPATPPPPDFTVTPQSTNVTLVNGRSAEDVITIGRIGGSTGDIRFDVSGLPEGVRAQFTPDPATSQSTLTLTADPTAPPTGSTSPTATITATPLAASAGAAPRSIALSVPVQSLCADVLGGQGLVDALNSGCKDIHVDDAANIDLATLDDHPDRFPGYDTVRSTTGVIHVPDGVTLESDRSPTRLGAVLSMSHEVFIPGEDNPKSMLDLGANSRVSGLRLIGYGGDQHHAPQGNGIRLTALDVLVDNNEIAFWSGFGVGVGPVPYPDRPAQDTEAWILNAAPRVRIAGNFIHDNVDDDLGYGIVVGGSSYALIERNVFNFDKHDIAGDGSLGSGYIARLNFTQSDSFKTSQGDYGGHFDMHGTGTEPGHVGGTAGTFIDILDNTFRGDQQYHFLGHDRRLAFDIRGTPALRARFSGNVTEAPSDKAIKVSGADESDLVARRKLIVRANRFSVNTTNELAVGDFDGDGCSDVFLATGTVWEYSACGRREWRFLNSSGLRLSRLAFGDFNGDGKTDVFSQQSHARWLVSYGGTGAWTALPAGSNIAMSTYRFGDLNGDGKTDVFRASGSRFSYSSAGASAWLPLARSNLKVASLRLCDFDADRKSDVFSLANDQWSVSYGGTTPWHRLNRRLSSNLAELQFADFNGDGRCDIARAYHGSWQVSWGGTSPWHYESPNRNPGDFSGTLLGHFDGKPCADVLRYGLENDTVHPERYTVSTCLTPFVGWSLQNML
jgi:hypothetical protein